MNLPRLPEPFGGDLTLDRRIDRVCDDFEAEWRRGRRPTIADYLGGVPEPGRPGLLRELIELDVIYRQQAGEVPQDRDYQYLFDTSPAAGPPNVARTTPWETETKPAIPGYEIMEEVGRGGMGIVYKARHLALNRLVALKLIQGGLGASEEMVQRFRREARAASTLDHPTLVPIYEIGEHGGQHYFTMGFVQGISLQEFVRQRGLPEPRRTLAIVSALAEALAFAHERGVIHRDLKPDNILIDAEDRPRLTDFGLAKRLAEHNLTATGQIVGTPAYMAPEQAQGRHRQLGPATDVYGLGGVLYFLLTGRDPFEAENLLDQLQMVVGQPVVPPRELNAAVWLDLEAICLRCLEKEPGRRYPTAAALSKALQRVAASPPATPIQSQATRWGAQRIRVGLLAAAAFLLALEALLASGLWEWAGLVQPTAAPQGGSGPQGTDHLTNERRKDAGRP